jgi:hypothetical protein
VNVHTDGPIYLFRTNIALLGPIRSSACKPVILSTLMVWVWSALARPGATSYVSQSVFTYS